MERKVRPIVFDEKGIAVYSDDGSEQARYNPKRDKSPLEAQKAAWQAAFVRGDIEKSRYFAFMTALESNYQCEADAAERIFRERGILNLAATAFEGYQDKAETEIQKRADFNVVCARLDALIDSNRKAIKFYSEIQDKFAA